MRVKGGFKSRQRRKKILKRTKGYYSSGSRSHVFAKERNDIALTYSHRDRRNRKRDFRGLWIQRINAAARINNTTYSRLMGALHKAGIELDRKVLSDMAIFDAAGFTALVKQVGL